MKRKRMLSILLAAVLVLPMSNTSTMAAEFTDGSTAADVSVEDGTVSAEKTADHLETLFSDGAIKETVEIDRVTYQYREETDSYCVSSVFSIWGNTVRILDEISGKKVTEIGRRIFDVSFQEPPEPYIVTGELILPDTITRIGEEAFAEGDMISMYIPDGVAEIGKGAFTGCSELRFLHFPSGASVFPSGLFADCAKLETIEIGKGVTKIEDRAMTGCPALREVHIPASVTEIGEDLFYDAAAVTVFGEEGSYAQQYALEHEISFKVEGEGASENPQNVKIDGVSYIYQEETDSYQIAGFDGDISSELYLQEQIGEKPVTSIAAEAFLKCSRLEKIHIPGSVKNIGDRAFSQCMNLTEAAMEEGAASLGEEIFAGCQKLSDVQLPDSIASIGAGGFSYCTGLNNLRLSAGLTAVEDSLFKGAALKGTLTVPDGVISIGSGSFYEFSCDGIILPDTLKTIGKAAFLLADIEELVIPDSVTEVGQMAFMDSALKSVIVGRGVASIRMHTFTNCRNLEEVILPESVVEIGKYAFRDTGILRVYIPDSVKRIHKMAFAGSSRLTLFVSSGSYGEKYAKARKIPYDNGNITSSTVIQNGIQYQMQSSSDTYILTKATNKAAGQIDIPERINGKPVSAIAERAFYQCEKVEGVRIPDTVTVIGESAFAQSEIRKIRLSENISEIKPYTFYNTPIETAAIPQKVKRIGERAFDNCFRLEEIRIPASVSLIGEGAFSSCFALKTVYFQGTIKEIPDRCFEYCNTLRKVVLPKKLEQIGERAFASTGIRSIELPGTLQSIGKEAFMHCTSLKELVIPGSVRSLSDGSFNYCTSLEKAVLQDGTERLGTVFYKCGKLREVHIPDSVYFIYGLTLAEDGAVYGNSGSKAYLYCSENRISFVSTGTAVLEKPEFVCRTVQGNTLRVTLSERCDNADFYDYVISEDKDFPENGKALYQVEKKDILQREWRNLDKGAYYTFVRSGRILENGETEYSSWTMKKAAVSIQAPDMPVILKAEVNGSDLTVTMARTAGTSGYGLALANDSCLDPVQEQAEPVDILYTSKNNKSQVYTFKNVKPGWYKIFARTYTKDPQGRNVYSPWTLYSENAAI